MFYNKDSLFKALNLNYLKKSNNNLKKNNINNYREDFLDFIDLVETFAIKLFLLFLFEISDKFILKRLF